jgi:NADPH:quinone reductase-like Zn-dependent oxidoreductase
MNPKDFKVPLWFNNHAIEGSDVSGTVAHIGPSVTDFSIGDRVAAYLRIGKDGGYAEYSLATAATTFKIPETISFEEASTIGLAATTAALGLFAEDRLALPSPFQQLSKGETLPIVIYGASSSVGAYALQLAKLAGLYTIAVAGKGLGYVESLQRADILIDYRGGEEKTVQLIKKAVHDKFGANAKLEDAYDAISENGSMQLLAKAMDNKGKIAIELPRDPAHKLRRVSSQKDQFSYDDIPDTIETLESAVPSAHGKDLDFAQKYFILFGRLLSEGMFRTNRPRILKGGLLGIEEGLQLLKDGKVSAEKLVVRVDETPGLLIQ